MTDKIYWFVAAVFREIDDVVAALAKLRAHNVMADGLIVLAGRGGISRKLNHDVAIATVDHDLDGWRPIADERAELGEGLRELLDAAKTADDHARSLADADGKAQRVYAQLRQDADDGANILVANVANPAQQLSVARILLRQNCERVLTHEIAASTCYAPPHDHEAGQS